MGGKEEDEPEVLIQKRWIYILHQLLDLLVNGFFQWWKRWGGRKSHTVFTRPYSGRTFCEGSFWKRYIQVSRKARSWNPLTMPRINQYQSSWKNFQEGLPADTVSINQALVLLYLINVSETVTPYSVLVYRCNLELPLSDAFDIRVRARSHLRQTPPQSRIILSWPWEKAVKS